MKEGDIVLTALVQADGQVKNRPALVLRVMPQYGDLLVCGVSSQLRQEIIGFDEVVRERDIDFGTSGLKVESVVRLGFLAVLPVSSFVGGIGEIAPERHSRLIDRLARYLMNR